jgi:hypothetical protein
MSYASDHMAWQQRVSQEMGAYGKFFDKMLATNTQLPPGINGSLNQ